MFTELLVRLDGSPLANAVIPHAVEIARRVGGGLHAVRDHTPLATIASPPEAAIEAVAAADEARHGQYSGVRKGARA